jgi:uracil-DNA glycosylase
MELQAFRARARALLAQGIPPEAAQWDDGGLFAAEPDAQQGYAPAVAVPREFMQLCETVLLHRDARRLDLLYRLLWRLAREPQLRGDPLDTDMIAARHMARAVGRDIHKMRAFLRFREVGGMHVAWYEPEHRIVRANAPWFARRFASMRWAILTPDECALWDGTALRFEPGARREDAPAPDAGEALWLTYYRSIFNPARINLAMMQKEMPRKYWRNLPEAELIAPLAAQALERSARMIEQPAPEPARRIPVAVRVQDAGVGSIEALNVAMARCRDCPIGASATQAVPGRGPAQAALMLVGEQPGEQEDLAGEPFVGPAGQLLREALAQAGIDAAQVFLTNAVRHFKFELRGRRRIHKTPGQREAAACAHWLEEEIALVRPRRIVALGGTAARTLLAREVAVTRERGTWLARADGTPVLLTWHPSALLRMQPAQRAEAMKALVADLALAAG